MHTTVIVGIACSLGRFEDTMWGRKASVGSVEVEPLARIAQNDIRTAQVKQVLFPTIASCSRFNGRLDVGVFCMHRLKLLALIISRDTMSSL
jgi:hypothetical protein